jgi:hypothetical protein
MAINHISVSKEFLEHEGIDVGALDMDNIITLCDRRLVFLGTHDSLVDYFVFREFSMPRNILSTWPVMSDNE